MLLKLLLLTPSPSPSPDPEPPYNVPVNGTTVGILVGTALLLIIAIKMGFFGDQSKGNWK